MAFARARNPRLDPRFNDIALWYKHWGEAWRVRWDYAFFQMALETNYLSYRRPNGARGDVHETQNNFAGIGATGGGVPGDRFRDVATGVHAQIQHLVAYSGERVASPIAPRTAYAQELIVAQSLRLAREVTFGDLARRWAVDRQYARSIDAVAGEFRAAYCVGQAATAPAAVPGAARAIQRSPFRAFPQPSGLGGPKPLNLAGPVQEAEAEVLPWLRDNNGQPDVPSAPAASAPAAKAVNKKPAANVLKNTPAAKAKSKADGPVRTIWSRDSDVPRATQKDIKSAPAAPLEDAPNVQAAAPIAATVETPAAATETASFFPTLPLFRIAPPAAVAPSRLGGPVPLTALAPQLCRVLTASYGGRKTLLVKSTIDGQMRLTALTVHDGFEQSMFETYARAAAPGAEIVGEYATAAEALSDAQMNCDSR